MDLLAAVAEQGLVRRVPDERVVEDVPCALNPPPLQQTGIDQPFDLLLEDCRLHANHGGQQLGRERPTDHGGDLRHVLRRPQMIEPCAERLGEGSRDGQALPCRSALRTAIRSARLENGPGELLDEQRHPVGPRDQLANYSRREPPLAG